MTYFNRLFQVERTFESILRSQHRDFEIIIVDDGSDEVVGFEKYSKRIHTIRTGEEKDWCNPVIPYNLGIHKALSFNPSIVILQNAECYHYGDIMTHAVRHLRINNYLSFSALSLDEEHTKIGVTDKMIKELLPVDYAVPYNPLSQYLGWYNHPVYLPRGLDFCAAITATNLRRINGYDERFAKHIWYGDDDLLGRVKLAGLQVEMPEMPFVVHQWHDHNHITEENSVDNGLNLYNEIQATGNIKAVHTFTPDFI